MPELAEIFAELGISHYLNNFLEQGFDTWETILDITESDFDHLEVKLGHRRKIQRRIANSRGLSTDRALVSPRHSPAPPEEVKPATVRADANQTSGNGSATATAPAPHGAKRKYRRHPKPDENAPERSPSAYVIFSNKMREDLKGRNLSFTEIAKLVGENWQNLSQPEKEPYEQQAFVAKERFNNELTEYKKTGHYKEYQLYLAEFKSKHSTAQQGLPAESPAEVESVKRPKLEPYSSTETTSSGTASSSTSQHGAGISNLRDRAGSTASINGKWYPETHVPQVIMPKLPVTQSSNYNGLQGHTPPTVLPGYRDSIRESRDSTSKPHQPLPRRDVQREVGTQHYVRSGMLGEGYACDSGNFSQQSYNTRRTEHIIPPINPPPLLTSESTNSTASSTYFGPRTPLEAPSERELPVPAGFYQKNNFDHPLPPLRRPSLSPQSTTSVPQLSPQGSQQSWSDYPPSMAPMRAYGNVSLQHLAQPDPDSRYRDIVPPNTSEEDLIPISALLSLHKGR